jgi:GTP:adenosylcobinamide-phosphate guanylyltransferase/thiamine kinase-like enzyme
MSPIPAPTPVRHVIVQAGGKGTRLEHYCWNKPKCLVPINGATLLYSLFRHFDADTEFIVIGNHHFDVLERVITTFPPQHRVRLVRGQIPGTIDGLADAIALLPNDVTPFLLVWSDIFFEERPQSVMDAPDNVLTVGVTRSFPCRWRMGQNHLLEERATPTEGVFGLFKIPDRTWLAGLPAAGGEFVRWLSQRNLPLRREYFDRVKEYGTLEALHSCWAESSYCRFFNEVSFAGETVVKKAKFASHAHLISDELAWYRFVQDRGYPNTPQVLAAEPMTLKRIAGRHPFDLPSNFKNRRRVLEHVFDALGALHALAPAIPANSGDAHQVYLEKTLQRLANFQSLVPEYSARPTIHVNGYPCRNPLHPDHRAWFHSMVASVMPAEFTVIHGDPTFSNTLVTDADEVRFIDPRGRFGGSAIFGDPMYDWAKLYYSVVGGYDQFNRRQFLLSLDGENVEVSIRNSGWAHLSGLFEARFKPSEMRQIQILHALIWLGLSGYVQDDYDSILGSFFKGILELNHITEHETHAQHPAQDLDLRSGRPARAA